MNFENEPLNGDSPITENTPKPNSVAATGMRWPLPTRSLRLAEPRAADQMPAGGEHEAAHRRLVAKVHQRAGVAGRAADAEADQHVAELGDGRDDEGPGEVGQAEKGGDLAKQQDGRAYPRERRRRPCQRGDRQMVHHRERPFPPDAFRPFMRSPSAFAGAILSAGRHPGGRQCRRMAGGRTAVAPGGVGSPPSREARECMR